MNDRMKALYADSGRAPSIASPIQTYLMQLHGRHAGLTNGVVATYIPELATADPDWFAICVATTDGHAYEVGNTRQSFTIQSISKPFVYGLALEDRGRDAILAKVGVEPSGDAFNSISLTPETGCPLNPMINAGAIATTSLVAGRSATDKLDRLLAVLSTYAGRPLAIDDGVYQSERDTGHRNRAIAHLLRNFDVMTGDPEESLNLYFQQCSVLVDCRDLALMAATLANNGVNPATGERAVRQEFVDSILGIMTTCGMYDYAGQWVYRVGLPAKSGVAGGILAVLPGQLGIGVFSPRLDARGNSVRGVAVCQDISRDLNLHFLQAVRSSRSAIRNSHNLADVSSKRVRSQHDRQILDRYGHRIYVCETQGDLVFAALERSIRAITQASSDADSVIVDCRRVSSIAECASLMFRSLLSDFEAAGKHLIFSNVHHLPQFVRTLDEALAESATILQVFPDLDQALEWCENRVLAGERAAHSDEPTIGLAQQEVCRGLSADAIAQLERLVEWKQFRPREVILRRGDPPDGIYLLTRGEVSVTLALPNGQIKRLSTLSAGMVFGELAAADRRARTADVRADSAVECALIPLAAFDRLGETHPAIKLQMFENLLCKLSRTVDRLNQEILSLSS